MHKKEFKRLLKKIWYFIWEEDSLASWVVNIILAFVLIKFIVYPGLGLILSTTHPIVAVVSSSMEHRSKPNCIDYKTFKILNKEFKYCVKEKYRICGKNVDKKGFLNLDEYWEECGQWYESNIKIFKKDFDSFIFKNGFNKGDIMVLRGGKPQNIKRGDVIVFRGGNSDPIIHRVIKVWQQDDIYYFQTKGDNNQRSIEGIESNINENKIIGKAVFRIPLLGYIKIWFVDLLRFVGILS
jgi:signal peptidase I